MRAVQGAVFHTADADPDRLENNLNPGGAERVVSGADPTSGALLLGFEDLRDFDFNDVVVGLGPIVVPPPVDVPPASLADLDGTNGFRLRLALIAATLAVRPSPGPEMSTATASVISSSVLLSRFSGSGESYVVFGRASGFGASLELATLDGTNGFRVDNSGGSGRRGRGRERRRFRRSSSAAFQVPTDTAGASFVVFGRASGFGASVDLASLDGTNGFRLDGIDDI